MTNYQKTKIYKIESSIGDKIYVGSTAKEYLSQRFQQHKNAYKRWKDDKTNKVMSYEMFDEYGVENCEIILIESYPCNSKDEKNARERYFIKELNCINKCTPGQTQKEYYELNKVKISELKKQSYENNKEVILEQGKNYRVNNKDKISEHMKKYYLANKEKIAAKKKVDYQRKKAARLEEANKSNQ